MTFAEVLAASRSTIVQRLLDRAALSNKLAKSVTRKRDRDRLYEQKSRADSRLLLMREAYVEQLFIPKNELTLRLSNGCRQHIPVDQLTADAAMIAHRQLTAGFLEMTTADVWTGVHPSSKEVARGR